MKLFLLLKKSNLPVIINIQYLYRLIIVLALLLPFWICVLNKNFLYHLLIKSFGWLPRWLCHVKLHASCILNNFRLNSVLIKWKYIEIKYRCMCCYPEAISQENTFWWIYHSIWWSHVQKKKNNSGVIFYNSKGISSTKKKMNIKIFFIMIKSEYRSQNQKLRGVQILFSGYTVSDLFLSLPLHYLNCQILSTPRLWNFLFQFTDQ